MEQISKKLMNWASILEDNTREQAVTAATMPFIHPHLASRGPRDVVRRRSEAGDAENVVG
ncbi:MAG: hypothetical protein CMJ44_06415 [Pimelobacter sp.]|nr:hypothetical protein [Pimelobacter sp.]